MTTNKTVTGRPMRAIDTYEALQALKDQGSVEVEESELEYWLQRACEEDVGEEDVVGLEDSEDSSGIVGGSGNGKSVYESSGFEHIHVGGGGGGNGGYTWPGKCRHAPAEVRLGGEPPCSIWLASEAKIENADVRKFDFLVSLNGTMPGGFGVKMMVYNCEMQDFGVGVGLAGWKEWVEFFLDEARRGKKLLAFCTGGHGRTGTFGASMIAAAERGMEGLDPIAEIRARYCKEAVESHRQQEAVEAVLGREIGKEYFAGGFGGGGGLGIDRGGFWTGAGAAVKWASHDPKDWTHATDCPCRGCEWKREEAKRGGQGGGLITWSVEG